MAQLITDFDRVSRLRTGNEWIDVHLNGRKWLRFIRWTGHGYYSGPITAGVDAGNGGFSVLCREDVCEG